MIVIIIIICSVYIGNRHNLSYFGYNNNKNNNKSGECSTLEYHKGACTALHAVMVCPNKRLVMNKRGCESTVGLQYLSWQVYRR